MCTRVVSTKIVKEYNTTKKVRKGFVKDIKTYPKKESSILSSCKYLCNQKLVFFRTNIKKLFIRKKKKNNPKLA